MMKAPLPRDIAKKDGASRMFRQNARRIGEEIPKPPGQARAQRRMIQTKQSLRERVYVHRRDMGEARKRGRRQAPSRAGADKQQAIHAGTPAFQPLREGGAKRRPERAPTREGAHVPAQTAGRVDKPRRARRTGAHRHSEREREPAGEVVPGGQRMGKVPPETA